MFVEQSDKRRGITFGVIILHAGLFYLLFVFIQHLRSEPSLLAGLPDYISCLNRAVVNMFLLDNQHWHVSEKHGP